MSTSRAPIIPDGTKFNYFAMLSTRYKDEDNQRGECFNRMNLNNLLTSLV
jgi:hypothetical protein